MSVMSLQQRSTEALYRDFLSRLDEMGFAGEISDDYASRVVLATDNSIYQRLPQAVVYPTCVRDLQYIATLLDEEQFQTVVVAPRGGGTGTNGQSLTDGIVVDISRHMNTILDINVEQRWARVQAGVVKDQLNAALKPYGLFFAPDLSTSNRATIGGMVNTDASGQGSCVYGKTRDHVLELKTVLLGGTVLDTVPVERDELASLNAQQDRVGDIYRTVSTISSEQDQLIKDTFPPLNRCLTGYDLAHLQQDEQFNLNSVLCGAEGTLGLLAEAKVNLLPIPNYSILVNVRYPAFMDALRDAKALMTKQPLSIETVDSKVLKLAKQDTVWQSVEAYFPEDDQEALGINLVEFSGDTEEAVNAEVEQFTAHLEQDKTNPRLGYSLAKGHDAIKKVYAMRKRAVGLLGNVQGEARPQPFVEDMAVPPENLADFIFDLRSLLDSHGLQYGMFGHVDAGVLHVRPLLDMKDPQQASMIRPITDAAVKLIEQYGGLLWGEHGKGLRSEYVPSFFGELYPAIQQVKAAFDPRNQLNPGKIATPATQPEAALLKIDEVELRGEFDRQIPTEVWQSYGAAMHCNGNGACFNYDLNDAMCPSWKATRERIHSPKGRASLMREWVRLEQQAEPVDKEFADQVYQSMAGCLACKSCAGQCPVKVNVPELRSQFLSQYHDRYMRPVRDYVIATLEFTMPYMAKVAFLYNGLIKQSWVDKSITKLLGMVDTPTISHQKKLVDTIQQWDVKPASKEALSQLSSQQRERSVIMVQDVFTRYFDSDIVADYIELVARLGYQVWLAPLKPNGKPLHVQGFRSWFDKTAKNSGQALSELAAFDIPLVGLDPAMTLVYRQEYKAVMGDDLPAVLLPQEWLLDVLPENTTSSLTQEYRLLSHCTERTNAQASQQYWPELFARRGLSFSMPSVGCCGMSGTYGHEARNLATSETIFQQSWQQQIDNTSDDTELLATGYSCRSQVKRFKQQQLKHPIQILLASVQAD